MSNWPSIEQTKLSPTLHLSHFVHHGYWIWDGVKEMNLAMRAKTRDEAFVDVIHYYQKRLVEIESAYRDLKSKVDSFVEQFVEEED